MLRFNSTIRIFTICCLLFPLLTSGEGTKQILLTSTGHGKIQVNPGFNDFAWYSGSGVSGNSEYRLNIHISNVGEKIYFGFGDPLNNNDQIITGVWYRIKDPLGNIVVGPSSLPLSGVGHINTFDQAVAGPSGIVGGTGYLSLSHTATMTGDYFIEFNFNTGWPSGSDRCKFRYFDITVGSLTNQAKDGRVWSKGWQMTADNQAPPSGTYTFWGTLYVYSDDGIVTSVDFNGMEPYVFAVSCNPWGCFNTSNFNNDRRSVGGNHTLTQYKIFLNDPDLLAYPTGILGTVVPPIVVTPSCSGSSTIEVNVTKPGNLDIVLNINPSPGIQVEDVQLNAACTTGVNTIPWNGLNGLGQQVPNGTTFNVIVTYINGLTNLPIYDVEQNPSGFIIELHRPTGAVPPVFWDDILVGGTQNFDGCTFTPPTTGCHTFAYSQGNNNTVNTWWYAVTSTSPPVVFTELRAPQSLGTITGTAAFCPGATSQIYWVHPEPNTETILWNYTGTGATITPINDSTITVDFTLSATSGNLTAVGFNSTCGMGPNPSVKAITIYDPPAVNLPAFTPVCLDDPPFVLSGGTPAGGTYSINSIPVTTFDPGGYGVGSHEVYYTYTDGVTGCTGENHKPLVVNPVPVVTLATLPTVCSNDPSFILSGGNPANGIYSGPGVTNDSIFNPSTAGIGTHQIIYIFTNGSGCSSADTNTITVDPLPDAAGAISGPSPVCQSSASVAYSTTSIANATSYEWSITPAVAGTVSGTTSSILINWSASFTGTAQITVKGLNNCGVGVISSPFDVEIHQSPVVTFTRCFDSVTYTTAQPIVLKGGIPLEGIYSGTGVTAGVFYPALAGSGVHTISYRFTNMGGCFADAAKGIVVQTPASWNCGETLTDPRDGKQYPTVQIATQCWMAANLNYGTQISGSVSQRDNCINEKYCYNNNPALCAQGSVLYQWDEVMAYRSAEGLQGFCPPGWHLPAETEWLILFNQFINNGFAGNALKTPGYSGFEAISTGFLGFSVAWRYSQADPVLRSTVMWSSTPRGTNKAWAHGMNEVVADSDYTPSVSYYPSLRNNAFSVR
ncbi:MAG: hypothetical protein IH596_00425, partial [Bacteroidales bacterium]|nr:hypothetical protein [Bacteroidales bacterium]